MWTTDLATNFRNPPGQYDGIPPPLLSQIVLSFDFGNTSQRPLTLIRPSREPPSIFSTQSGSWLRPMCQPISELLVLASTTAIA